MWIWDLRREVHSACLPSLAEVEEETDGRTCLSPRHPGGNPGERGRICNNHSNELENIVWIYLNAYWRRFGFLRFFLYVASKCSETSRNVKKIFPLWRNPLFFFCFWHLPLLLEYLCNTWVGPWLPPLPSSHYRTIQFSEVKRALKLKLKVRVETTLVWG